MDPFTTSALSWWCIAWTWPCDKLAIGVYQESIVNTVWTDHLSGRTTFMGMQLEKQETIAPSKVFRCIVTILEIITAVHWWTMWVGLSPHGCKACDRRYTILIRAWQIKVVWLLSKNIGVLILKGLSNSADSMARALPILQMSCLHMCEDVGQKKPYIHVQTVYSCFIPHPDKLSVTILFQSEASFPEGDPWNTKSTQIQCKLHV